MVCFTQQVSKKKVKSCFKENVGSCVRGIQSFSQMFKACYHKHLPPIVNCSSRQLKKLADWFQQSTYLHSALNRTEQKNRGVKYFTTFIQWQQPIGYLAEMYVVSQVYCRGQWWSQFRVQTCKSGGAAPVSLCAQPAALGDQLAASELSLSTGMASTDTAHSHLRSIKSQMQSGSEVQILIQHFSPAWLCFNHQAQICFSFRTIQRTWTCSLSRAVYSGHRLQGEVRKSLSK